MSCVTTCRGDENDFVDPVDLVESDRHFFMLAGRHVLADVVGADRELAVTAVDQADQLDGAWSAQVDQRVQGGARGAAGVQHVVDQDDRLVRDVDRDAGRAQGARRVLVDVVALQRDVELTEWDAGAFELANALLEPAREWHAARLQADQDERLDAVVALDHFVSQTGNGAPDVVGAEQSLLTQNGHRHSFAASRGAQLKVAA
jgi:hypothetical protein